MNTEEVMKLYGQYLMPTYKPSIVIEKAKGSRVYDASGKQYYDMTSGIGVHNVGHCTEGVIAAIQNQASQLGHCSNLFINEPQVLLAKKLVAISGRSSSPASGAPRTGAATRW